MKERWGRGSSLIEKDDQGVLKSLTHMMRMSAERLRKRIYVSEVVGTVGRGRLRRKCKDGVKKAMWFRGLSIQDGEGCACLLAGMRWSEMVYEGRLVIIGLNQGISIH